MARKKVMMPLRTSGSPPVMRSFCTPRPTKAEQSRSSSSSVRSSRLGQELHVLGHAVDAAEVAAVGDRNPQVGDRARERVDQAWLVGQGGFSP